MIVRNPLLRKNIGRLVFESVPNTSRIVWGRSLATLGQSNQSQGAQIVPKKPDQAFTTAEAYINSKNFKNTTGRLGTKVSPHYQPHVLVNHPPSPKDITLELLLASGAHLGHLTSLWNPGNARYIYGVRDGIHIISLEIIAAHLRRAAKVVEGIARKGGVILFLGTREGQARCVVQAAKLAGGYHVFDWWVPGTITNAQKILEFGTVVEKDMRDRVVSEKPIEGANPITPDLVVCFSPLENKVALHECALAGVPTIAIIDTDVDPTRVTYPIPCNDDSLRAVQLVAGILGRAGETGRNARIRDAEMQASNSYM